MEAANSGVLDLVERESRSIGLPIDLPMMKEPANKHLDIKSSHRRFTSRLDEFMRLSNAVVVAPGGIGTLLELLYVWQLLQVGLTNDRPMILLGKAIWGDLLEVDAPHLARAISISARGIFAGSHWWIVSRKSLN